jgi:hypothetical protein
VFLEDAKQWLRERLDEGARCPCCTQEAKIYRRSIHANMARVLILLSRLPAGEYAHVPTYANVRGGDYVKLKHWGFIEQDPAAERDDGSKRVGWWRITEAGRRFVKGEPAPRYIHLYAQRFVPRSCDEMITVEQALGQKFNYNELMGHTGAL